MTTHKPIASTIGALVAGTLIFAPVATLPARADDDDWEDRWEEYYEELEEREEERENAGRIGRRRYARMALSCPMAAGTTTMCRMRVIA